MRNISRAYQDGSVWFDTAESRLRRTHECVLGVLALESEPVDPRLKPGKPDMTAPTHPAFWSNGRFLIAVGSRVTADTIRRVATYTLCLKAHRYPLGLRCKGFIFCG